MRVDDDGLLQALHEGMFESALWSEFLTRLMAKTGARHAAMMLRPVDSDGDVHLHAGQPPPAAIHQLFSGDAAHGRQMRPGRAYSLEELFDPADAEQRAGVERAMLSHGLTHLRAIRVAEAGGADAWLILCGGRMIGPATGALLTTLAPHLRIALRTHATLERERFRLAVSEQAIERLKLGWLTLDRQCRIMESTPNVEQLFRWGTLLRRGRYDRLVPASPALDRELVALVKSYAGGGEGRSRAFRLNDDPWVDMLVAPAQPSALGGRSRAAAIVYISGDRRSQADRCDQLADLFGLLPSEARLAWLMAQATSIADAADALGLTVETARNYSKKIYAKTGARGHAELVRIILTSVLAVS
jgi:DNA-binding CsgD family transcriptional regulator